MQWSENQKNGVRDNSPKKCQGHLDHLFGNPETVPDTFSLRDVPALKLKNGAGKHFRAAVAVQKLSLTPFSRAMKAARMVPGKDGVG